MTIKKLVIHKEGKIKDIIQEPFELPDKFIKEVPQKINKICLSTIDGFEFINLTDIIYCKANGSYTTFIIKNQKPLLVSKNLKEYENLLIENHFMRVHNSFLVNLNEVKKYVKSDGGYLIMSNDDFISISKKKKDEFLHLMSTCF